MRKKPNGWVTGDGSSVVRKRRLRDATLFDRCLFAFFVFVIAGVLTGVVYFYVASRMAYDADAPIPLVSLTGVAARKHFLLVCCLSGVLAAAVYGYWTIKDPYGTTAAAEAAEKERAAKKRDRFEFLDKADK